LLPKERSIVVPSHGLQRIARRTFSVIAVVLVGVTVTAPAYAQPTPPPGGESDLRKQYKDLAAQAAALDDDLLEAKHNLAARQGELTKANADLDQAMQTLRQAQTSQQQFQGTVDEFLAASFQGARLSHMSALIGSDSADEFLDRMSALSVLAADTRASLDSYTGSVDTADQARRTAEDARRTADAATAAAAQLTSDIEQRKAELDGKIKEVRAALNRLSPAERPAERADLGQVKDNGVYLGPPNAAGIALQAALDKRGAEYEWAGVGPTEFDCSGLTMWAYTGVVRFTIMMVRRKLGDPPVIETVPGAGYRIP
jgi:cell wall-associated NlpC family hydrolase